MFWAHFSRTIIDFSKPDPTLLFCFAAVDPNAQIEVKFVTRQEHPPILGHKFDRRQHVINLFFTHKVAQVESSEAHPQQFVSVKKGLFESSWKSKVNSEDFLSIDGSARTARSCLNAKQIVKKRTDESWVENFAESASNNEWENGNFGEIVIAHQEKIRNFAQSF